MLIVEQQLADKSGIQRGNITKVRMEKSAMPKTLSTIVQFRFTSQEGTLYLNNNTKIFKTAFVDFLYYLAQKNSM